MWGCVPASTRVTPWRCDPSISWADHPFLQLTCSDHGHICRYVVTRKGRRLYHPMKVRITRGSAFISINTFKWWPAALLILEAFAGKRIPASHLVYLDSDRTNIRLSNLAAERPRARVAWRGRPRALTDEILLQALERYDAGEAQKDIAASLNVSPETLRVRLRELTWQRARFRKRQKVADATPSSAASPTSENS